TGNQNFTFQSYVKVDESGSALSIWYTGQDGDPENNFSISTSTSPSEGFRVFWEHSGGTNYVFFGNGDITSDSWAHLSTTWDGTTLKLYINGELVSQDVPPNGPGATADRDYTFGGSGFIDELSIWNIALSQDEIQTYMETSPSNETGLVSYWNFNEGEGNTLTDISGNGNSGTIYEASWSGDGAPVEPPVLGCTDSYAENYNSDATADDGSCAGYPDNGEYVLSFDGIDDYVPV
ncbi:uncharacterized protein METZ01_LOCUS499420, partial [marine metagenome]